VSDNAQIVEQLLVSDQNCSGARLNWMQQWLDNSTGILQNDTNSRSTGYESSVSDTVSEGNNFHLSPVALANDDSGLTGISAVFPQQSNVVEQCLQSVNLADLLLNSACTAADSTTSAVIDGTQQPVQLDSMRASLLPGGQITYVVNCRSLITYQFSFI